MAYRLSCPRPGGSSWTRDRTRIPCIGRWFPFHPTTKEVLRHFDFSANLVIPQLQAQFLHISLNWVLPSFFSILFSSWVWSLPAILQPHACRSSTLSYGASSLLHFLLNLIPFVNSYSFFVACGARVKNLPANAGDAEDVGSAPRLGKFPRVGNGNLLQYSCLENSMDRGAREATVHGVAKSWTRLSD